MSKGISGIIKYGTKDAHVMGNVLRNNPFLQVEISQGLDVRLISTQLIGEYNLPNVLAAVTVGKFFNTPEINIKNAIENYTPTNSRSQFIQKGSNKIILDAYNANPSSMAAAIENFIQLDGEPKIVVLGDMFELGKESLEEHKKIVQLLVEQPKIEAHFIGKDFFSNKTNYPNLHFYNSFEAFSNEFKKGNPTGKTILIKGSRGMALERTLEII